MSNLAPNLRPRSWLFHAAAMFVLGVLDTGGFLVRTQPRHFIRIFAAILILILAVTTVASLRSIRSITADMQIVLSDAVVGVDAATAMRTLIGELQTDIFRQAGVIQRMDHVESARTQYRRLWEQYREGALTPQDQNNVVELENFGNAYFSAATNVAESAPASKDYLVATDRASRALLSAIDRALEFNKRRLHESADLANASAKKALQLTFVMWSSLIAIGLLLVVGFVIGTIVAGTGDMLGRGR